MGGYSSNQDVVEINTPKDEYSYTMETKYCGTHKYEMVWLKSVQSNIDALFNRNDSLFNQKEIDFVLVYMK